MTSFKIISHAFVNISSLLGTISGRSIMSIIASIEMINHCSDFEIGLPHLQFFLLNKMFAVLTYLIGWILLMRKTVFAVYFAIYIQKLSLVSKFN